MKIFIDSADLEEIKKVKEVGILNGVTTNPSLIKKASEKYKIRNIEKYIIEILKICKNIPISLEVVSGDFEYMVKESFNIYKKFGRWGNVYVKIPVNPSMKNKKNDFDGIKAIKFISGKKIPVNCTLIFTPEQALLAAKAGAKIVSPFAGRIDDYLREKAKIKFEKTDYFPYEGVKKGGKILEDKGIVSGIDLVKKCVEIFKKYNIKAEVLAASIRNARQFREAAEVGADIATLPFEVIEDLLRHYKTKEGMEKFLKDAPLEYKKLIS